MSELRLSGQAGVITGGGNGIGAATACELARLGARVVIVDHSAEAGALVAAQVTAAGGEAVAVTADVRRHTDLDHVREVCLGIYGRLDFVVAGAGIGDTSTIGDGDPDRWRAVVETNVLGVAYTARALAPVMAAQGRGHLVLLASVSGRESYVGEPIYIASKWAVVGLGHALRKELKAVGVRVTLVEPGLVDTPMARANPFAREWLAAFPALQPEDIACAVAYALTQPAHVAVNEIVVRPLAQEV